MLERLPLRWPAALLVMRAATGTAGSQPVESWRGGATTPPATSTAVPTRADGRRRYRRASLLGGLVALVPNVALLVGGGFFRRSFLGGFYDAQAHSLLDLRWDVPADVLSVEAFVVHGKAYMYFGPTPALLRLPVAAVTDRFDGRLTSLSLLLALVVALVATTELGWRVRRLLRGDAPVAAADAWAAGAATCLVGAGSVLLLLDSAPVVYHEAIAWAVALALAADVCLLAFVTDRGGRALAAAVALATAAVLARPSVGLGPVLALGLLATAEGVRFVRSGDRARTLRPVLTLAAAAALPVALYAAVNLAKFDTPFGVPWRAQALSQVNAPRQAFLRESGGSLFGAKYAPTALLQYVRPDALSVDRSFPWIDFPGPAVRLFDVPFDVVDWSSSLPATMPWLVALAVLGSIVLVRRSEVGRSAARAMWAPVLGAVLAVPVTLGIAYIAGRYLADFLPLLVLLGLVGLHDLLRQRERRWARVGLGAVGALGLAAVAVNLALAMQFQGVYGPETGENQRSRFVRSQTAVNDLLPGDQSAEVRRLGLDDRLPDEAEPADLVVVGECAALYQYNGRSWRPVEQTPDTGRLVVRTRLRAPGPGRSAELITGGQGTDARSLSVELGTDGRATFVLRFSGRTFRGTPIEVPGGTAVVDADFDRRLHSVAVRVDGRPAVDGVFYVAPDDGLRVAPSWPAAAELQAGATPACDGLGD